MPGEHPGTPSPDGRGEGEGVGADLGSCRCAGGDCGHELPSPPAAAGTTFSPRGGVWAHSVSSSRSSTTLRTSDSVRLTRLRLYAVRAYHSVSSPVVTFSSST